MGHSYAALIQTPAGAQILVDGGRNPARLLTALGDRLPFYDRHIELLVITHPDPLDTEALDSVLERYSVGAVIYNGQENESQAFGQIMDKLRARDAQPNVVSAGYSIDLSDGAAIEVLHPQRQPDITTRLHDAVLTLRLRFGDTSFLLTSDLSVDGQREMLRRGRLPTATVLQLPRHGGRASLDEEFLGWASPSVALLQLDAANRAGDPDPDVLAMLGDVPVIRTDETGAIHLSTDGSDLRHHQR